MREVRFREKVHFRFFYTYGYKEGINIEKYFSDDFCEKYHKKNR